MSLAHLNGDCKCKTVTSTLSGRFSDSSKIQDTVSEHFKKPVEMSA